MVYLSDTETDDLVTFMWQSTASGDVVDNPGGINFEHPTVLAAGKVRITVSGQAPTEHSAAETIILPTGVGYRFDVLEPGVLFCTYNLLVSGAAEEVAHLRGGGVKLYP